MSNGARAILVLAVLASASAAVFGPALVSGEVFTLRDHYDYFQPMRIYTSQHLRAGRLPLWNPYNASGEPWLANPQTGVFYPPAWLFVVLPFPRAYVLYLLVHALLVGGGGYLLFSRWSGLPGALAGGVSLMLAGPVLSLMDVTDNFTSFAWVPLILWRALGDRERGSWRASAMLLAAAFLAGEPFFAALAALGYVVIVRKPATIAKAGAAAAGVAAVQMLPFLELLRGSDRFGGFAAADVLRSSVPLRDWPSLFVPPQLVHLSQSFIWVVYSGALVGALALAGVIALARERRWPLLVAGASLIGAVVFVASGPQVLAAIPVTLLRYPARLIPFAVLAIAGFAAAGWDRLRGRTIAVDVLVIGVIVLDLASAAHPLLSTTTFYRSRVPYSQFIGRDRKILQDYAGAVPIGWLRRPWISGYLNLLELRFQALTPAPVRNAASSELAHTALASVDVARAIGVGYVLASGPLPEPYVVFARRGEVTGYRLRDAWPMAYVVTRQREVIAATALALDASRAVVRVASPAGGVAVLTQNDAPGWSVTVDGKQAQPRRVFRILRAVEIGPGRHEIVWRYRPPALIAGAFVTLLTIAIIAISALAPNAISGRLSRARTTKSPARA